MWERLDPRITSIESAFEPLLHKANQFDHPWSIAELKLSSADIQWLHTWFAHVNPKDSQNWLRTISFASMQDSFIPYPQILGGILISIGAEVCREHSREDSVWPAIRSILPTGHPLHNDLFLPNGQPSALAREMIAGAVRTLNLRHAMDIEGTQQWFVTVKLQFGFTFRGAKSRLAEWLVGLGPPQAVEYLNGDSDYAELSSDTFQSLWRALKQYRQGRIEENEARTTLTSNPWVKPKWIDDLLVEAKAKIDTLGTGEWPGSERPEFEKPIGADELCPITEIYLEWPEGGTPSLRFVIDAEIVENETSRSIAREIEFFVDGVQVGLWRRQPDDTWAGRQQIPAEPPRTRNRPNLAPTTFIASSRSGDVLLDWDFADSGLSEEIIVFDLDSKRMLKSDSEWLDRNRRYAIICDRRCNIQGCTPLAEFKRDGLAKKVVRLPVPLDENLCLVYDDFMLWQPLKPETQGRTQLPITLRASPLKILSLNDRIPLWLEGLPQDAEDVKLLIHRTTYVVQNDGVGWSTLKNVTITPQLAARQRRTRVRFKQGDLTLTIRPQLELPLLAAAIVHPKSDARVDGFSLDPLIEGDKINRSEGTRYLRVWEPHQDRNARLFEADCSVARLRRSRIKLRDIPGHGGELHIVTNGQRMGLSVSCQDMGCVQTFRRSMLGSPAQLFLLLDKNPEDANASGYIVYQWTKVRKYNTELQTVNVLDGSTHRVWQVQASQNAMALVLTWKGLWLGAWWSLEEIRDYLSSRRDLSQRDFAILKWLRLPVLDPILEPAFDHVVNDAPAQFVKSWLLDYGLPTYIHPHDSIIGCDSLVRHFLWPQPLGPSWRDIAAAVGLCDHHFDKNRCCYHLASLFDINFGLFGRSLMECRRQCHTQSDSLCRLFLLSRLRLDENSKKRAVSYRLQSLQERVTGLTGISNQRLDELVYNICEPGIKLTAEDRAELLTVADIHDGRQYMAAKKTQHWINRFES